MKLSLRKALLLYTLVPVMAIFLLFAIENIVSTKEHERQLIEAHMTNLAQSYVQIFNGYLIKVAGQANTVADLITAYPELNEQEIYQILAQNVKNSTLIHGMAVAYVPYQFDSKRKLFSPYVYRKKDKIKRIDIGTSSYDYTEPQWQWWHKPLISGQGVWGEPYFDEGAGNIMMSTYSVPFFKDGEIRGVATVDIPLRKLNSEIKALGITKYKIFVLSGKGKVLVASDKKNIGMSFIDLVEEKYQLLVKLMGKKSAETMRKEFYILRDDMLSGREGKRITEMGLEEHDVWYFHAPIVSAGWSAAIGVNESEAFEHVYNRLWYSIGFFSLLLFLLTIFIFLAAGKLSRAFDWIINRCQRIERMNFQPAVKVDVEIDEISQLSNTLDNMCQALDVHFSSKEDVHFNQPAQQQSLPISIPEIRGYSIDGWHQEADNFGGKTYDVFALQQSGLAGFLLLNDSDKGIGATIKDAQLQAIYRTSLMQGSSFGEIAAQMNDYLFIDPFLNGPVQVWFGMLVIETGRFTFASLGRNTVFQYSEVNKTVQKFSGNSAALSMHRELSGLKENELELLPEDVLVICSEGVFSALNKNRETFTVEHIESVIQQHRTGNAGELLGACRQTFLDFTRDAHVQTDCTIIVIKRIENKTNQLE